MEKELLDKELSSESKLEVDLVGVDVVLKLSHESKGLGGSVELKVKGEYLIDKLAEKIPGEIDDQVFALIKAAMKA